MVKSEAGILKSKMNQGPKIDSFHNLVLKTILKESIANFVVFSWKPLPASYHPPNPQNQNTVVVGLSLNS